MAFFRSKLFFQTVDSIDVLYTSWQTVANDSNNEYISKDKCPYICTLPWQWSLITSSQLHHSFHHMFPSDHCRLMSIFHRKVRWSSVHIYNGHLLFDVVFSCTLRCLWLESITFKMFFGSSNLVHLHKHYNAKWVTAASAVQNVRYCFPTRNRFTAAVGLQNIPW